jgi:hypothetical protein
MLSDVQLNDVVTRVLGSLFPGASPSPRDQPDAPLAERSFRIPYAGDLETPRVLFSLDVEATGVLADREAQEVARLIPEVVHRFASEGQEVETFGGCSSVQGTGTEHLTFDDRLVATILEARGVPASLCQALPDDLRFLRFASEHRYEGSPPEISLVLELPPPETPPPLGRLSLDLLRNLRSFLILGRGGAAAFEVGPEGYVRGVRPLPPADAPVAGPARLAALAALSRDPRRVCLHLDTSPSIQVFHAGSCILRYRDGQWVYLGGAPLPGALGTRAVAEGLRQLACDLADAGKGAILCPLCPETHGERLLQIADPDCLPGLASRPSGPRGRFNQWLRRNPVSLLDGPSPLLRNLAAVDGATFLHHETGHVLGHGAVVEIAGGKHLQGARSTAGQFLAAEFGAAIVVSEDRVASLHLGDGSVRRIW